MKQKNVILMVVAVGCGLVAAFLTTQINAKPKVDQVEVVVAVKDLPVGTVLTKADLDKLLAVKKVAKDALPPNGKHVIDKNDLADKRLGRGIRKDDILNLDDVSKGGTITLPDGKDMYSLPMSATDAAAGYVGPGSRVDVLATLKLGAKLESFPLLIDMHVLTVNNEAELSKTGVFPNMSMVSFAVSQEEALLLSLAQHRGCHLRLLLRYPGKPKDPNYDMKKVRKLLEDDKNPTILAPTRSGDGIPATEDPAVNPTTPAAPATAPAPKSDTVKVLVATEDIPAGTSLTKDLIETKFKEREFPKDLAEGAFGDLTPCLGLSLKGLLGKGQWVTESLVGVPPPKPAPQDEFSPPKPDPKSGSTKPPPTVVANRAIRDVAVHTASGTVIHRFEEVKSGEWKLKKVLSPEEAAQTAPAPAKPSDDARKKID